MSESSNNWPRWKWWLLWFCFSEFMLKWVWQSAIWLIFVIIAWVTMMGHPVYGLMLFWGLAAFSWFGSRVYDRVYRAIYGG